jgi:hypothetical protein
MAYTKKEIEEVFNYIVQEIETGRALRNILKEENTPSSRTFFKWLDEDDSKVKRYARATELRSDCMFEDILNIADENHNDVSTNAEGIIRVDSDIIARARLRVDARKWYLSKLNPKKYGDKIDVNSNNVNHNINQDLTAEEVKKISDNLEDNY